MRIIKMLKNFWINSFSQPSKSATEAENHRHNDPSSSQEKSFHACFNKRLGIQSEKRYSSFRDIMWVKKTYNHSSLTPLILVERFLKILISVFLLSFGLLITPQVSLALPITLPNNTTLTGSESNFTFAKSIWTNTSADTGFKASKSYLLIDDINRSGTLYVGSPTATTATIKLYELIPTGTVGQFTTILAKDFSGSNIIGFYYVSSSKQYLVETSFPNNINPHVTFDFFPDGDGVNCTNLASLSSGRTCDQSWFPAHFRKEVDPWIRGKQLLLKSRIAGAPVQRDQDAFSYLLIDSSIDAGMSLVSPGSVIAKKIGQLGGAGLTANGYKNSGFMLDQAIQHGIVISSLITTPYNPVSWVGVVQQLTADAVSIAGNINGILSLKAMGEEYNATIIARDMLRTQLVGNLGDYNALIVNAGLNAANNPSIYNIIDGFAARSGFSNTLKDTQYNPVIVERLYTQGIMGFGNWVFKRKTMANPFDDVDGDGVKNTADPAPNDPTIPAPPVLNQKPVAVIAPVTGAAINTSVTLDGTGSYDPDGTIASYQWTLSVPPGSTRAVLSSTTAANPSFTPDASGSYTIRLSVKDSKNAQSLVVQKSFTVSAPPVYTSPIAHPKQWLLPSSTTGALPPGTVYSSLPKGYTKGLKKTDGWCVNVGPALNNGCFNAGKYVSKINMWLATVDQTNTGAQISGNYRSPPSLITPPGASQLYWNNHDSYSPTASLAKNVTVLDNAKQTSITITLPKDGTHYFGLYSFAGNPTPSIFIDFQVYTNDDIDGDGVLNINDAFPRDPTRQYDSDGDGIDDKTDAFPLDVAASVDTDGDGYPNAWNSGKSGVNSTTGLKLDLFINNSKEWADADKDGVGDNADKFPSDIAASKDTDGDGFPDGWNLGKMAANSTTGLVKDLFPLDASAALDSDLDGAPDLWNPGKSSVNSTSVPKLHLDAFKNDPVASLDSDKDGFPDALNVGVSSTSLPPLTKDLFPNDPTEWKDSDGDKHGDNSDVAPNDPTRWSNVAPVLALIASQTVNVGKTATVTVSATDKDGDPIAYRLLSAPVFVTLSGQKMSIAPQATNVGLSSVVIKVSDSFGGVDSQVFAVNVAAAAGVNQGPNPTATPIIINAGATGTSQVLPNDPNKGDTHTYAVTTQPNAGNMAIVSSTGLVTYTSAVGFKGQDFFVVTVTDQGGLKGTVKINVTVNSVLNTKKKSCNAILNAGNSIGDGIYTIYPNGANKPGASVYCDMTTNGGGWTYLMNPVRKGIAGQFSLGANTSYVTGPNCSQKKNTADANWYSSYGYSCAWDNTKVSFNWSNTLGATEVMFRAIGGGNSSYVTLNGVSAVHHTGANNAFALTTGTCNTNGCGNNQLFRKTATPLVKTFSGNLNIVAGGRGNGNLWGGSGMIWGVAVREPVGGSNGLIAHYPFSGNANDVSASGWNGVVSGATLTADRNGKPNSAYAFNGASSIDVTANIPEQNFTMALWFKTSDPNAGIFSVNQYTLPTIGGNDRHIYLTNGRLAQRIYNNETIKSARTGLNDGKWHHVAMVVQTRVGQKMYIDGKLEASGFKDRSDFTWQAHFLMGYSVDAVSRYLAGSLDELRIYNRPLTGIEITQLAKSSTLPKADLVISKTDGKTSVTSGSKLTYTIVAKNNGLNAVIGATVTDTLPGSLTGAIWTCVSSAGSSCSASGTGNIADAAVNLLKGGTATYTLKATLSATAVGKLVNKVTITAPVGVTDSNPSNNSATDTDLIIVSSANLAPAPTASPISIKAGQIGTTLVKPNDPNVGDTHTFKVTGPPTKGQAKVSATGLVTYTPNVGARGADQIAVTVTDQGNKSAFVMIKINITVPADKIPPVITLKGGNVTIAQGAIYIDAGATASDNVDGNLTNKIAVTNNVNTSVINTYTVTYNVKDAAGNSARQVTRTVKVVAPGGFGVSIAKVNAAPAGTVNVPVMIAPGTGSAVAAFNLAVNYDGSLTMGAVSHKGMPASWTCSNTAVPPSPSGIKGVQLRCSTGVTADALTSSSTVALLPMTVNAATPAGTVLAVSLAANSNLFDAAGTVLPTSLSSGSITVSSASVSYNLIQGWNLIAFPLDFGAKGLTDFLAKAPSVSALWTYKNGQWKSYIVGVPSFLNSLTAIKPGDGYWVKSGAKTLVSMTGVISPPLTKPVYQPGWHLIGTLAPKSNVPAYLTSQGASEIWGYNNGNWCSSISGIPAFLNCLKSMQREAGYFIKTP